MNNDIWLLSTQGICNLDGQWIDDVPFQGRRASGGTVASDRVFVIVEDREIWQYKDTEWAMIAISDCLINDLLYTSVGRLLAATEGGRIAWVEAGRLHFNAAFEQVPSRHEWYTAWGGPPDTHSLVQTDSGVIYAGIHVGWIMRSTDRGGSWEQIRNGLFIDVHKIIAHPKESKTLLVATAEGLYVTEDEGTHFQRRYGDQPLIYLRTCALFSDTDTWLVSAHDGPHRSPTVAIYRSENRGQSWLPVQGLPETGLGHINTLHAMAGGYAIAVGFNCVYTSQDYGATWERLSAELPPLIYYPFRHHIGQLLCSKQ